MIENTTVKVEGETHRNVIVIIMEHFVCCDIGHSLL
jgi:hypothetical protein